MIKQQKAIFMDKDGTLIIDVPYNVKLEKIVLSDCTISGLRSLKDAGFLLIIVSNQSGIAKGYFREEVLIEVESQIKVLLSEKGIELDGFYYCPHHPEGIIELYAIECKCRKPHPGMLLKAADDFNIDLSSSWMIGDILNDIESGNKSGCKSILIDNGNETEWLLNVVRTPAARVKNIDEAAKFILINNGK